MTWWTVAVCRSALAYQRFLRHRGGYLRRTSDSSSECVREAGQPAAKPPALQVVRSPIQAHDAAIRQEPSSARQGPARHAEHATAAPSIRQSASQPIRQESRRRLSTEQGSAVRRAGASYSEIVGEERAFRVADVEDERRMALRLVLVDARPAVRRSPCSIVSRGAHTAM